VRRSAVYPADAQRFSDAKVSMLAVIHDLQRRFPDRGVQFREPEQQAKQQAARDDD
jgi:hypothetical protein